MKKIGILVYVAIIALVMTACAKKAVERQAEIAPSPSVEAVSQESVPEPQPTPQTDMQAIDDQQIQREKMVELQRFLNEYVYFDFDQAVLRADAMVLLQLKAQWLRDNPDYNIFIIEGHCDERGTDAYNLALGERRAEAVKQYLTDVGLSAERFQTHSYGEERPLDEGHHGEAWAKNRRAAFVIKP